MTFLTNLEVTGLLRSLVLDEKARKKITESTRLEFLKKFEETFFLLLHAEDYTSGPLNRGGAADLPLLRTLVLAIYQMSLELSSWEVIHSLFY